MDKPIVECIPNFSEARRPQVVKTIADEIRSVRGIQLLDQHSDLDHNRTVITFVGPPEEVKEAAFRAISKAAELIDLNKHSGEHPRIGATDVVPFVPISGVTIQDCVSLSESLGKRVGDELGIPVYLYEEAAKIPERRNLEKIRRGQYEGLKEDIQTKPERKPDYGPSFLGTAGATVIGAREPLIAFNVFLTTDDVKIAKSIAKTIRQSSGGLRYVKAIGLLVDHRAQVSMNLTNFRQTPMAVVVELIRTEASSYGVGIHHCEVVGLIPQEALVDAAKWYMHLDQFLPDQILENRLFIPRTQKVSKSLAGSDFLDALASKSPTPGGGSAAAFSGSSAAALIMMVVKTTMGKPAYSAWEGDLKLLLEDASKLQKDLFLDVEIDAKAFESVMEAYRYPKESMEERQIRETSIQDALLDAAKVPLDVAEKCVHVAGMALMAAKLGNIHAITDAGVAFHLAAAGFQGAALNVEINLKDFLDAETRSRMMTQIGDLKKQIEELDQERKTILHDRAGLSQ